MTSLEKITLMRDTFARELKPDQFNFGEIVEQGATWETKDGIEHCGTVCCFLGWMPKFFPKSGIYYIQTKFGCVTIEFSKIRLPNSMLHIHGTMQYMRYLLGLESEYLVRFLFYGDSFEGLPMISQSDNLKTVLNAWTWVIDNWDNIDPAYTQPNTDLAEFFTPTLV